MDLAFSTPITSLKNGHCKWLSNRVPRSYREGTVYLPLRRCYWPTGTSGKEPACQRWRCKSCVFDLWVVKIPWRRKWHPLRYSCLGNPMDRGAWQVTVHGAAKSQTRLKWLSMHSHTHTKCQHVITFLGSPDSRFLVYNLTPPLSCPVIHLMVIGKEKASRDFLPTLLGPGDPCQWEKLTINLS